LLTPSRFSVALDAATKLLVMGDFHLWDIRLDPDGSYEHVWRHPLSKQLNQRIGNEGNSDMLVEVKFLFVSAGVPGHGRLCGPELALPLFDFRQLAFARRVDTAGTDKFYDPP
jgi:hypothetical protein